MQQDEQEIRQLVADWIAATKNGDSAAVLDLMSDDVVFLMPGRPPMDKREFAAVSQVAPGQERPAFEGKSEIREIQVCGDWAWMWTELSVTVKPPGGASPMTRAGYTLSILRKQNGKWVIARDANMLAPVKPAQ
jgi:uncharacterized protein (TIGR02246 family)